MNATPETLELMTAKLLDGTISDSEYQQLEKLVESHPGFAQNVTELVRVEGLLKSLRHTPVAVTPGLLEQVEGSISAMISSNAAAVATGAAVAGKTIFAYIAGALGVAAIAGVSYWAINSSPTPQNSPEVQQINTPAAVQSVTTPAQQQVAPPQQPLPQTAASREIAPNQPSAQPPIVSTATTENIPTAKPEASMSAPAKENKNQQLIAQYKLSYQNAVDAKDSFKAADFAKKLGVLYFSEEEAETARQYFGYAFSAAQNAGLTDFEGEAHGELGRLEKKAGNVAAAKEHLAKAVQMLNSINAPADKWQKELDGLNAPKNR